jgi:hypothetical protein
VVSDCFGLVVIGCESDKGEPLLAIAVGLADDARIRRIVAREGVLQIVGGRSLRNAENEGRVPLARLRLARRVEDQIPPVNGQGIGAVQRSAGPFGGVKFDEPITHRHCLAPIEARDNPNAFHRAKLPKRLSKSFRGCRVVDVADVDGLFDFAGSLSGHQ